MKGIIITLLIVTVFVGGVALVASKSSNENSLASTGSVNNVTVVDGIQLIDLKVKGGYSPQKSIAQAGLPTVLRFNTNGTFDCSSSVRIPSLNIDKFLPQTGELQVDIGIQSAGVFRGFCSMGMYPFEIDFRI